MLSHPEVELDDEGMQRRGSFDRDQASSPQVLDEVSNIDHHDIASRTAAKTRGPLALPSAATSSEMPIEQVKKVAAQLRDGYAATA